jgi:uncharacterized protein YegP (UPF0339 family)
LAIGNWQSAIEERRAPMTYFYYKDRNGEWRWRLRASNGNILADSGEGYANKGDCLAAIESVKKSQKATVIESQSHEGK